MSGSSPAGTTTTTQTQNNIPFNASQLLDVQNGAIDARYNNPLNYYPGTTYAQPNSNQTNSLTQAGNTGYSAGQALSPLIPNAQATALANNTNIAFGAPTQAIQPMQSSLFNLGQSNPASQGINSLNPIANGSYYNGISPQISSLAGLGTNSAAAQGLSGLSTGAAAQGLGSVGAGTGTAANQLSATANGAYLGSNPNLDAMFQAASAPVTRAYMTATAPQTASAFEAAGRTNSGAAQTAQSVNQRNLGDALGNLSANIYGTDYANERGLQTQAANSLGNLQNTANTNLGSLQNSAYSNLGALDEGARNAALTQATNATNTTANAAANQGSLGVSGNNSQAGALTSGIGNYLNSVGLQQNAINQTPAQTNQAFNDYQTSLNAGTQQQQLDQQNIQDQMNRFYGNEYEPWQTLQQESGLIGSAIPGLTTGSSTSPYYQNPMGQALGGALGAASLGSTLFGNPAGGLLGAAK